MITIIIMTIIITIIKLDVRRISAEAMMKINIYKYCKLCTILYTVAAAAAATADAQ